ncbi:hypothetical protein NE237_008217 [Protea cynaroides]|uniref:Uncharacterized protein n=1 Tax=Protea cynaroides TaxID=273540 RepID=A0A9Q0QWX3_9MAGN|nr:hypothetical protein NE237_008217 [Protea cynaroides]
MKEGLDTCLLPMRKPHSDKNLEELMHVHGQLLNDHYGSAVKHLRVALYSTPLELAALLPLIQLLLLGDHVNEAMGELEKLFHNTNMTLPLRKSNGLEIEMPEHYTVAVSETATVSAPVLIPEPIHVEDTITVGETASVPVSVLIPESIQVALIHGDEATAPGVATSKNDTAAEGLVAPVAVPLTYTSFAHVTGEYNLGPLVEMIALHLDATYATCDIWGELASCFLKLSQLEEAQKSVCGNENECGGGKQQFSVCFNVIPRSFIEGNLRMLWKLHCRWWSRLHFSKNIYDSDMQAGKFQLLKCKAACASHLYGPEFDYVKSVCNCLDKEDNKEMMLRGEKFHWFHQSEDVPFGLFSPGCCNCCDLIIEDSGNFIVLDLKVSPDLKVHAFLDGSSSIGYSLGL